VCAELSDVSLTERERLNNSPADRDLHTALVNELPSLNNVEVKPPDTGAKLANTAKIGFWNAERCKYLQPSALLLEQAGIDIALLTEMDVGMARSGQLHTPRAMAERLGMGYALGIEYVELGLGDKRERTWHAGEINNRGLHGAALCARVTLDRPTLLRLEQSGDWFDGARGERRIGGRIALAATVTVADAEIVMVTVHLESHSDPAHRAGQMRRLLDLVSEYADARPVTIGGDFNTKTAAREALLEPAHKLDLMEEDPQRFVHPVPYEPLFELAEQAGFDWRNCNVLNQPSERTRPDGTPRPPLSRLDWFFTRGLAVNNPRIVPAVDTSSGTAISDHELLVVDIQPLEAHT